MKVNKLLFCLLFLMLGTTTAWADKYYQPGSYKGNTTPRLTLEQAVGKKFFIYNTAINGGEDRTGFLRNGGVSFVHDKSKERDLYVYNESFVYTMEAYDDNTDGVNDWYAIKSVNTGLYVNINGKTDILKAADAKLYITSWDNSAAADRSNSNMESWQYNVVANGQITSTGSGSTVHVVKNGATFWNGGVNSFTTYSDGHPFAFYIAHEVTSGDYLEDLHIYSRSDIYSAQVIYGYIRNASQITSSPSYTGEGGFANLIDGDAATYNVTNWGNNVAGHYYQIDLETSVSSLYFYMQRRADGKNAPVKFELQASTDGSSYTKIGDYTTELDSKAFYTSDKITLNGSYRYLRIVARETSTSGYNCVGLSELYVLPGTQTIKETLDFIAMAEEDNIYKKTTERVYRETVEKYNSQCPDAKLLSGVPLPGNKYRIYADAYDVKNHVYVNREIKADSEFDDLEIVSPGSYHKTEGDARKMYEWYCERTADGYLVFRNVANPGKYLGFGKVVNEPYKWGMSTMGTQRHGVPLKNIAQQYLAVENTGDHWMGNVTTVQDQTVAPAYVDHDNNPQTDIEKVADGLCTDFVFIPVPLEGAEKKITITANDLVKRNTRLLFDVDGDGVEEVHKLPFSRMFVSETKFNGLKLQLLCNDIHKYNEEQGVMLARDGQKAYNTEVATLNGDILKFNYSEVQDGDILDIQLDIIKPVNVMPAEFSTTKTPSLYLIRNKHQLGLSQQARPNRAGLDIEIGGGEGDGPISSQTGKRYYARFNQRDADMDLIEGTPDWKMTDFDATSLFYFTAVEGEPNAEYYSVYINNATTAMKCADHAAWNTNGNTWFIQPKKITNNFGYNIGRTILDATNNPYTVWGCSHDEGDKIVMHHANDDGTAWEFIEVDDATARTILKAFIDKVAAELNNALDKKATQEGIDATKVQYYRFIVNTMKERAAGYYDGSFSTPGDNATAKLLQFAQNIHMLEHEIEYALYELPELSDDVVGRLSELENFEQPHWYYIRNVNSVDYYAAYDGNDTPMALQQYAPDAGKKLANMFYFVGEKNSYASVMGGAPDVYGEYVDHPGNNLIIDEYLKAHMHTFLAKDYTLVSKNVQLDKLDVEDQPGEGQQMVTELKNPLNGDKDWSIELEYDLSGNTSYNAYGSCLLTSSSNPLKDDYKGEFQVYLKDDRSLVIKVNNKHDTYRFWHTQDYFSHIKVVITYSQNNVTLDVYNSMDELETIVVPNVKLYDVTALYSALPATGATITNLATYQVEKMTWKEHLETGEGIENKDEWYIMPSSNPDKIGLAIVLDDANDKNMGWARSRADNTTIVTDLGTVDNATWKFERVIEFDAHVDELLAMYDYKDCVIYDKDIARLYALILEKSTFIKEHENDPREEAAFNELYYAFLNYKGRTAAELQAPKPGSLYTIRPMVEENTANALVVHVDKSDEAHTTKEVYNGAVVREDDSYDPRGVWMFEGTAGQDGFLALNGLKLKNIHAQCYLTALGADASAVNEGDAAQVTLGTIGGCITKFQVGGLYMNRATVPPTLSYDRTREYWGDEVTTYPDGVKDQITLARLGDGTVRCKRLDVEVKTEGEESSKNVVVTFTNDDGNHKINILGVELLGNNGEMLYADYHYGRAGGELFGNTYTLKGVVAGAYTMNCYVFEPNNGDQLTEHKGHFTIEGVAAYSGEGKIINDGTATTKWIVEEILNPEESVYYETSTNTNGHSTLMLGFPTLIPDEVEAFYGSTHGKLLDGRYLSMTSYDGGILPANTPVVLRNKNFDVNNPVPVEGIKFYYSATTVDAVEDNYLYGSLYWTLVECASFDETDVDGDGNAEGDVKIYMLQASKQDVKMFWVYENYRYDGTKTGNNDEGGYVLCKANKAYMVLPSDLTNASSLSFRFDGNGNTTEIDEVEFETVKTIYDLQGRKLDTITAPGIYIVNGVKVLVK